MDFGGEGLGMAERPAEDWPLSNCDCRRTQWRDRDRSNQIIWQAKRTAQKRIGPNPRARPSTGSRNLMQKGLRRHPAP